MGGFLGGLGIALYSIGAHCEWKLHTLHIGLHKSVGLTLTL